MTPQRASRRRIFSMRACMGGDSFLSYWTPPRPDGAGRSDMIGTPRLARRLVRTLAGGERAADRLGVALDVAPDEDGLRLRDVRQLHPRELVPATGEVEEALPVAAREADDALGAEHAPRQAIEHAAEALLIERARRPVEKAADAVGVEVRRRRARAI